MSVILGEWREGKVRPIPGNAPHAQPVSRGMSSLWSICDDPFGATRFPQLRILPGPSVGVFKAWRNLSGPIGVQNQNQSQNQALGRDHTASRWSAPSPSQRTRREDHALSHRSQMSSGRLFLDRVGRHQSPSPLHRHGQDNLIARSEETKYHRTVSSVLTVCVSSGGRRKAELTMAAQELTSAIPPHSI